jgi:hypothetical protein
LVPTSNDGNAFLEAMEAAIAYGGPAHGVPAVDLFNLAAEHVHRLLNDAVEAFTRGSFGTGVFLAITAMEETAKAGASCFLVYAYPAFLMYAAHSLGLYWVRISPQASETVS